MASMTPLLGIFAKSPIGPIQRHMEVVHNCVATLPEFFTHCKNSDWDKAQQSYEQICSLENEADDLKRDLRLHLPKGLFLAISRIDLLNLLSKQDKIANKAQDIAGLALGREMSFPESVSELYFTFIDRSVDASAQANKAIHELDELLATGFSGREVILVEKMVNKLCSIESDSDEIQRRLRKALFALEKELPPVDVVFLYKIMDWIGTLADLAQDVGNRLELMMAK